MHLQGGEGISSLYSLVYVSYFEKVYLYAMCQSHLKMEGMHAHKGFFIRGVQVFLCHQVLKSWSLYDVKFRYFCMD